MGFFSWNCLVCKKSILNMYVARGKDSWRADAVAVTQGGSILRGRYDGYGRIDDRDVGFGDDPDFYHVKCWINAGKPMDYRGGSPAARDQGHFLLSEDEETNK